MTADNNKSAEAGPAQQCRPGRGLTGGDRWCGRVACVVAPARLDHLRRGPLQPCAQRRTLASPALKVDVGRGRAPRPHPRPHQPPPKNGADSARPKPLRQWVGHNEAPRPDTRKELARPRANGRGTDSPHGPRGRWRAALANPPHSLRALVNPASSPAPPAADTPRCAPETRVYLEAWRGCTRSTGGVQISQCPVLVSWHRVERGGTSSYDLR